MSRKLDFGFQWDRLKKILYAAHPNSVSDVEIMERLRFSPPSWKVWKPKFVEKANTTVFKQVDDKTFKKIIYKIEYSKKRKNWFFYVFE